ncbi:tyrocidine synthase 3 [Duganella sp. HH101]|nr:tyrocidine synthase 3 [Duganella sp. HH101]
MARMAAHFTRLLEAIVANPERRIQDLDMLDDAERHQLLVEWNETTTAGVPAGTIHALFEQRAAASPDRVALEYDNVSLTYGELNARANRLAHHLRTLGVGPDVLVGLCVERSLEMMVGLLAVLKAGGAYVPLDPAYPADRLAHMLEDAAPAVLLTQQRLLASLPASEVPVFLLDADAASLDGCDATNPSSETQAGNLAYVIYTSGSTGRPKGVTIAHGSALNLLDGLVSTAYAQFGDLAGVRVSQNASLSFDASVQQWLLLTQGVTLCPIPDQVRSDGEQLAQTIKQLRLDVFDCTPSQLGLLLQAAGADALPSCLLIGGEAIPQQLWEQLKQAPAKRSFNVYGPTEATVDTTVCAIADAGEVPVLGRPIGNAQIYLLDAGLNPVPVGVAGELHIAGAGLARGYLNRADLTADKFVPNPFGEAGSRMYKSGDLARYLEDGRIEYLGRIDHQVKLRGFRIELGEIEAVLAALEPVSEALVLAREDVAGDKRLVAYLVAHDDAELPDPAGLRAALLASLPEYMIPAHFMVLEQMPLTPNGKVDRKALPAPDMARSEEGYVAPRTAAEEIMAGIWAGVLRLDKVGVHDNFFALGGHSLLATQLVSQIRGAFEIELPLRAVFEAPTVAGLLARMASAQRGLTATALAPVERKNGMPLSFAQQRLWFLEQFEPGSAFYNIAAAIRLNGQLDVAALKHTLNEIVRRHEALRTRFASVDGTPVQVILPTLELALESTDLSDLPHAERDAKAQWLVQDEAQTPFDLAIGPLIRARLLRLSETENVVLLTMHHIVSDGWSSGILVNEVAALYGAYVQRQPSPLPELPIQYADFAHWQRQWLSGDVLQQQLDYWQGHLTGAPALLTLPTDHPRPAHQTHRGATQPLALSATTTAALNALSRRVQGTLFMTLTAAFNVLLSRYAGQDDICIGTPIANRNRAETEGLIGFFVNTLVLRTQVDHGASFLQLLDQVRGNTLDAYAHQDVPFEQLVEVLKPERHTSHSPLFQVMLALQNAPLDALTLPGLTLQTMNHESVQAKFDLTVTFTEEAGRLNGSISYNTDLFEPSTMARMAAHFTRLLEAIVANPEGCIQDMDMLDDAERHQLLVEWNETTTAGVPAGTIHALFEQRAAASPDRVALEYDNVSLTYGELNARANRLAHHLRTLGVGPDVLVGLCVERSLEMMVGLLAVLKAGGAYVPLDPAYPADRLAHMLEDAAPAVLLTQQCLLASLPASEVPVFLLDADAASLDGCDATNPSSVASAGNLAYVIYTSGSTGKAKGVAIAHASAQNLIDGLASTVYAQFGDLAGVRVGQNASLSFDASVKQWLLLTRGVTLCPIPDQVRGDGELLAQTIRELRLDAFDCTPSQLGMLLQSCGVEALPSCLLIGGEAIPQQLWEQLKQAPAKRSFNVYGPTEATVDTTVCAIADAGDVPVLGRPIGNVQVYLLDASLNPVPVRVAGELHIAGDGLARGYVNRGDLTADKFIPNPFGVAGSRMYKSGDLARYLEDGSIEYLGRIDHQVKLRGFRIELGEIEAALAALEPVREALVLAREDVAGDQRLVAYLVAHEEAPLPDMEAVRAALLASLPEYMVPAHFVVLEQLPLTPNGKVDRKALPAPDMARSEKGYVAPRTAAEEIMAGIWAGVLKLDKVGLHDDFFVLGGHSLLATQLVSQIRSAFDIELPLRTVFEAPTVAGLLARMALTQRGLTATALAPVERKDGMPLSFAQQRLWFLDQFEPGSAFYNIPAAVHLNGQLDVAALKHTLNEIVRRHEALRTRFASVDGTPVQVILPALELALEATDLSDLPHAERDAKAQWLVQDEAQTPFDLATGPLIRARLLRMSASEHIVLLTMHHIVSDGWSSGILVNEVAALYGAYVQRQPSPLPELPIQYADFAHWQRQWLSGDVLQQQLDYWQGHLTGAPALLTLPTDHPRPVHQTHRGATQPLVLSATTTAALNALSRQKQSTLFMTLTAAFNVLLSRYAGQDDICIGTPIANRNRAETEGLIGFFVNTLVLRTQVDHGASFLQLLDQVRGNTLDAYAHQDVPFEQLVEVLKPERHTSHSPLFQVMLALQNAPMDALTLPGLTLQAMGGEGVQAKFDLTFTFTEEAGRLNGSISYNTDLFEPSTMARMAAHFTRLLEAIVANPERRIQDLDMLDDAERHQLLVEWNDTASAGVPAGTIHALFEQRAAASPDSVALVYDNVSLTYGELNARANRLAHHLRTLGVGPDVLVGLCVERSLEMMVGLLAVLKAGGAYVPLDPAYPADRLAHMLEDAAPAVLLTQQRLLASLPASEVPVFLLDADAASLDGCDATNPSSVASAGNLAYVIYTSGSTGKAKGVAIAHASAQNLIDGLASTVYAQFGDLAGVRVGQNASLSFDASVKQWLLLTRGVTLCPIPDQVRGDGELLAQTIRQLRLDAFDCTPSQLGMLLQSCGVEALPSCLLIGGEAIPQQLWEQLKQAPAKRSFNVYGPTEATVDTTVCAIADAGDVPVLGRPIGNVQVYLLDASLNPVPVRVAGELHIAGDGLARGYVNRGDLTADKFIPNPFGVAGSRMYKSGDLARYLEDGSIEYLGRIDHQVKLRGFRIELGEIEAALAALEPVREALVLAREDVAGDQRLVAYLVAHEDAPLPDTGAVRAALLASLPEYMVPAHFVVLEQLPLTPNGKVDRKALPAPDMARSEKGYVAPRTAAEEIMAGIWAGVLKLDKVGMNDDFFVLGGHSLLATQLVSQIRGAFDIELPLRTVFEAPTVAGLLARMALTQRGLTATALAPVERKDGMPLSFAQQRLWFLDQFEPGSAFYNIPAAVRLNGQLDVAALQGALNEIVRRHEALRTRFASADGTPVQVIVPALELVLEATDLSDLPHAERDAKAQWLVQDEAHTPFDLATGPLIRARLLRLSESEHIVLLTMHHIVSDGWSSGILVNEVAALYGAYVQRQPSPLPELPIQYADFAHWQRQWLSGQVLQQQLDYWQGHLTGAPALLTLPTDHPRPAHQTHRGATQPLTLSATTTAALNALSRQKQSTLFMTLTAAFNVLLSRYAGQDDICIGTPIANRNRAETEGLIGFFVNTLVLRTQVDHGASFLQLLDQVRGNTLDAYAHQDVPFEQLVDVLKPERHTSHSPLFQVMLALQNAPMDTLTLPGLTLQAMGGEGVQAKFDLTFTFTEEGGRLNGSISYNTDLFEPSTMARMAGHFTRLLEAIVANPERRIQDLDMLDDAERHQLLVEWNETTTAGVPAGTIHALFEQRAAASPDRVALEYDNVSLTYGELNARANRLAHHLRTLGVGPDVLVGLCVERSLEMMVGLLAVLKAGGAYVPLDPAYPADRLAYMLEDAAPAVLLTQQRLLASLPASEVPVFLLDADAASLDGCDATNPSSETQAGNLAYVIYTSGSTGRPKGVTIAHGSALNLLDGLVKTAYAQFGDLAGVRVSQNASLSFDASVQQWLLLTQGVTLCPIPDQVRSDGEQLAQTIKQLRLDVFDCTPSQLGLLLQAAGADALPSCLLIGGEAIPQQLWDQLKQAPAKRSFNVYGPTEATVDTTVCAIADAGEVPVLGRPIGNAQIYLLDAGLNPVPVGVAGELHIAGAGLARGYLNRADLTADKFVPNPFGEAGSRMYKSGDLARYLEDGRIEYLGRIDHQVKLRGFRIELGEIEAVLAALEPVSEALVLAREDVAGDKRLVAYLVANDGEQLPDAAGLRAALLASLPEYMVPAQFVVLEQLPLTPNGKVDRKALPAPDMARSEEGYVAPRTPAEETMADIWAGVLNLDKVGVHDNFFSLGGHSLLALKVVSRVRAEFSCEFSVRNLFDSPTVSKCCKLIQPTTSCAMTSPVPVDRRDGMPLSFAQQRLWFLQKINPGSAAYNIPAALRLKGKLDVEALRSSLQTLVVRHEILRTNYVEDGDGQPHLLIHPKLELPLPVESASACDVEQRYMQMMRGFDLASDPLLAVKLLRISEDEHVLLINMHHILSDGWSISILCNEWMQLYAEQSEGRQSSLPALPLQYADYAHWQRSAAQNAPHEKQLQYWTAQLDGASELLNLPTDRPRPPVQQFKGASETLLLSPQLASQLRELGQGEDASLFMTLLTGFALLMSRFSGDLDLQIGTPAVNRDRQELEGMLGLFLDTLVMRADLQGRPSFRELLRRMRKTALEAYANSDVPFERIVDALPLRRNLSRNPLFQVFFNMLSLPRPELQSQALELEVINVEAQASASAKFDITIYASDSADGIHLRLSYNESLFDAERMQELLRQYALLLQQAVDMPDRSGHDYNLVTEQARAVLPDPRAPLDNSWIGAVHQLFMDRQSSVPDAPAVVSHECRWTYRELHLHSERIACFLQANGVGRGDIVAIYAARNATLVAAVLGVLKAGASYMMLDPGYPAAHLEQCLEVAPPKAWLRISDSPLDAGKAQLLAGVPVPLDLRDMVNSAQLQPYTGQEAAVVPLGPDDIAVITFTSGSTGKPKAVEGRHGPLSHFLPWMARQFDVRADDRFSMLSGLAHDPLQRDMFTSLCLGASLHIPHPAEISPGRLWRWLDEQRVTSVNLTPAMAQFFPEASTGATLGHLRTMLLIGDVLTRRDVQRLQQLNPAARIVSLYGSTETQRSLGYYEIGNETASQQLREVIPLGRGIPDVQLLVMNSAGQLAGIGEHGEVYLRSHHLARGYRADVEQTAAKFIVNPFGTAPDDRLYRTGDLGRYLSDGMVECLGRADTQVKLRGFRIELGHIESTLGRHPGVREAIVVVRASAHEEKHLVAYILPTAAALRPAQLRAYLRDRVPAHMQPAHYVMLDELPLTPNGKINRNALPAPAFDHTETAYVAPRSETEHKIVAIWAEILQVGQVGVEHNFFDLGGHSLLATRLVARVLQVFEVELSLHAIFQAGTVAEMAALVDAQRAAGQAPGMAQAIVKVDRRARRARPAGRELAEEPDPSK